ncbi:MAG: porin family protein [Bacteroidota bacterium]
MKSTPVFLLLFLSTYLAYTQVYDESEYSGTNYLEDQFYVGIGYNFLLNRPTDVVQQNLSYNLQVGFIKDFPINERRNIALGLGLGYATNSYYTNIIATETPAGVTYAISNEDGFRRSKFETHAIEIPFEFRWRTSTDIEYRFWRIYTGVKLAYVFSGNSKLVLENETTSFQNDDLQELQYGLTLNFGFNTWNVSLYYGLNPLLEDDVFLDNGKSLEMQVFRVGVMFYIL